MSSFLASVGALCLYFLIDNATDKENSNSNFRDNYRKVCVCVTL